MKKLSMFVAGCTLLFLLSFSPANAINFPIFSNGNQITGNSSILPNSSNSSGSSKCSGETVDLAGICVPSDTGLSDTPVSDIILALMNWLLYVVGAIAIIAFVVSGIMYLTAAGNENQIDKAKRQMLYAIIGIIVALAGLVIITAVSTWLEGNSTF